MKRKEDITLYPTIRPRTKGQAITPPRPATANGVRGIKYAICLHNRTHRTAACWRRVLRGRQRSRPPIKSRRDFCTHPTHHAAERVKWSASGATKKSGHAPDFFNKHENTPKTGKFSGCFAATDVPALSVKRTRAATPSLDSKDKSFESKQPQAFSPVQLLLLPQP